MPIDRLADMQNAVRDGSYCAAFTSDAACDDYQMHTIAHVPELNAFVRKVGTAGRTFLGVVALTPEGPRVVLTEPLTPGEFAPLSAAYISYVNETFTALMQQCGVSAAPQSHEVH